MSKYFNKTPAATPAVTLTAPRISAEQQKILDLVAKDYNVVVDSVAGSGKTTTVKFLAEANPDQNILVLTYNAMLKTETRERTGHIKNLEVHSYHSFCTKYYNSNAYTDTVVNEILETRAAPVEEFGYDVIVADESQDLTPLLFKVLVKVIRDNLVSARLVVMGDYMQNIYKYRGSDPRFITMAGELLGSCNQFQWAEANLSETYRCTAPTVAFLNRCVLRSDRLVSAKGRSGPDGLKGPGGPGGHQKPEYIVCNTFGTAPRDVLERYLTRYKPHEIFVIALSLKENTPIKTLANHVSNKLKVPIHYACADSETLDSRIIANKIVFTTVHQSKGRERPLVILFGFDEGYFNFFDKNADRNRCPNEIYVACTRASEQLVVLHDFKSRPLPFVRDVQTFCKFSEVNKPQTPRTAQGPPQPTRNFIASDLISYTPFNLELEAMALIKVTRVRHPGLKLRVPSVVKIGDLHESVADITGVAVPAFFEFCIRKSMTILDKNVVQEHINNATCTHLVTKLRKLSETLQAFYEKHLRDVKMTVVDVDVLLKIALYYVSQQNRTDYKLNQITEFTWLDEGILDECVARLRELIPGTRMEFEVSATKAYGPYSVYGEIDCIDEASSTVYEFKCTGSLVTSHVIQLAIYSYLLGPKYRYRLYNILTDELLEVRVPDSGALIKLLVEYKTTLNDDFLSDTDFLHGLVSGAG